MQDDTSKDCSGGNGAAARSRAAAFTLWLYRELVLRWNLERSHAAIATGYGLYLYPAQTFSSAPGTFGTMDRVGAALVPVADPEALWGGMMIIVGVATWLGIFSENVSLRRWAGSLRAVLWVFMAVCFYVSNSRSPAWVLYSVLAWSSLTRAINARRIAASQPE